MASKAIIDDLLGSLTSAPALPLQSCGEISSALRYRYGGRHWQWLHRRRAVEAVACVRNSAVSKSYNPLIHRQEYVEDMGRLLGVEVQAQSWTLCAKLLLLLMLRFQRLLPVAAAVNHGDRRRGRYAGDFDGARELDVRAIERGRLFASVEAAGDLTIRPEARTDQL